MKGLPPELLYVLLLVGVLLVQYLMKRRAGQQSPTPEPSQDALQTPYEVSPELARRERAAPTARSPSRASFDQSVRSETPVGWGAGPRRRFARQSLMGTRRDVQNAVVIAAILGPCRALEPPAGEDATTSPRTER